MFASKSRLSILHLHNLNYILDKKFSFSIDVAEDLPATFQTDSKRTLQILKNLLSNSFKFTSEGTVTLRIFKPDTQTLFKQSHLNFHTAIGFSVLDTGIGVPEEKQRMIFEAFQQTDGSTSCNFGGTGLGLTITRDLCRLLGGELQISSAYNQGCNFTIYLPLINDGYYGERELSTSNSISFIPYRQTTPITVTANQPGSLNKKSQPYQAVDLTDYVVPVLIHDDRKIISPDDKSLLIVENNRDFATLLQGIAKQKNYRCLVAGDGKSALHMAAQYQPSAILLDLELSDIDGLKILDIIKQDLTTRHIPVYVLTNRSEVGNLMNQGAVGYLQKPASKMAMEGIFTILDGYIDKQFKTILIVEGDETDSSILRDLLQTKQLKVDLTKTGSEALSLVLDNDYDCMIIDLDLAIEMGDKLLKKFIQLNKKIPPIIVHTENDITDEECQIILKHSQEIVVKAANSTERLLDELVLFLHQPQESLTKNQKIAVKKIHDNKCDLEGHTVLLVDDDVRNIFALSELLEQSGLNVMRAENGKVALELLDRENNIELVLMDIMMPVMDGYEAIRYIRTQEKFKKLPVIALTARAMADDRVKCMEVGADDYMNKPVDAKKLLSLIKVSLIDQRSSHHRCL